MTRRNSSSNSAISYQVTAPTYGGYPPPPPHYQQYPGYEMSEFAASNPYKNGRVQPISSHHTSSNSNGHYKNSVPIEDDDEIDRGHWGSKAEFILSCVGYSVSSYFTCCVLPKIFLSSTVQCKRKDVMSS